MTEKSYQECRKVMQKATWIRGQITKQKGEVAKWSNIEGSLRSDMKHGQADGVAKMLSKAIGKLHDLREQFRKLEFPAHNLSNEVVQKTQCEACGASIATGNTYCGECLCED